jgi:hypothetical protein
MYLEERVTKLPDIGPVMQKAVVGLITILPGSLASYIGLNFQYLAYS